MTRKQAVCKALALLKHMEPSAEIEETMEKLEEILCEMPFTRWSEETIHDTLKQFAAEHGRNPTATDLKRKGMPPHPVIKLRFGMTAKEFLHTFYPTEPRAHESTPYGGKSKEEWTADFIVQFGEIKPASAEQYDKQRQKKTPSWQTIARYNGQTRWAELLAALGLAKASGSPELTVTHTIRLGELYISDKEWFAGMPTRETMAAAIAGGVGCGVRAGGKVI